MTQKGNPGTMTSQHCAFFFLRKETYESHNKNMNSSGAGQKKGKGLRDTSYFVLNKLQGYIVQHREYELVAQLCPALCPWDSPGKNTGMGSQSLLCKESVRNARDPGLIPGSGRSLEKVIGTHFSILAWRIPWTKESSGLQSMGLQRAG